MKIIAIIVTLITTVAATHLVVSRAVTVARDLHQISEDIGAIRRALEPHPFSVGQETPPMREHVMLREYTARQQPEVTLL